MPGTICEPVGSICVIDSKWSWAIQSVLDAWWSICHFWSVAGCSISRNSTDWPRFRLSPFVCREASKVLCSSVRSYTGSAYYTSLSFFASASRMTLGWKIFLTSFFYSLGELSCYLGRFMKYFFRTTPSLEPKAVKQMIAIVNDTPNIFLILFFINNKI